MRSLVSILLNVKYINIGKINIFLGRLYFIHLVLTIIHHAKTLAWFAAIMGMIEFNLKCVNILKPKITMIYIVRDK